MRKCLCLFTALCLMLGAAGCGSLFGSEYYYSEPYREEASIGDGTETEVRNYSTLKNAVLELIYAGESSGQFRFGSYTGSLIDDLAAVCHEIKTSTPIGAYAVEDISYDTSRIVSYYTADISIEYKKTADEIASVVSVSGLGELGSHILSVMENCGASTVVKIYSSAAGEEYICSFVSENYYSDPFLVAMEPSVSVEAYPDSGPERIYVIDFRYGASPQRLKEMSGELYTRVSELAASLGDGEDINLALRCATHLSEMCENSTSTPAWPETAYGCIVEGSSQPLGLALGYKALCDRLGINCIVVRGEVNDGEVTPHAWNIIELEDGYYHVDISRMPEGTMGAFLLSDKDIWGDYVWDRAVYPACEGSLNPEDIFGPADELEHTVTAPPESQPPEESRQPAEGDGEDPPSQPETGEAPDAETPVG